VDDVVIVLPRGEPDALREPGESGRLLRAVIDNLPAMIGYWDRDLRNVLANRAYVEWFGWTPEQMRGHHIREVIGEELFGLNKPYMDRALGGEAQHFDRTIVDASGHTRYSQASYIPDVDEQGEVHGFFVLVSDVTARVEAEHELAAAKEELERLALTDGLTGLANRRSLHLALHQALNALTRATPGERFLAVLLIDLDQFKPINDTYGHAAGDEVLVELAHRLRDTVRLPDVVARIGGDELVVLAVDLADPAPATVLARRLVERIAAPVQLSDGSSVQLTASVGVAFAGLDRPLPSPEDLLREADARMYEAKAAGGNGVR
jgi:diguanylate cyclase (GGDEF)-like protein/PAS domain S-box-containing protein